MEKTIKARVQHKHDIEANWLKATNFTPLASEIIVYDPDENYDYPRIKIGNGETNINTLPFVTKDYAKISDIPIRVSQLTNDSNYLTEHQDISGKLDADKLPEAITTALAQAKESGEFDGKNGYNPIRGIDYWTGSDIAEIKSYVDDAILGGEW